MNAYKTVREVRKIGNRALMLGVREPGWRTVVAIYLDEPEGSVTMHARDWEALPLLSGHDVVPKKRASAKRSAKG